MREINSRNAFIPRGQVITKEIKELYNIPETIALPIIIDEEYVLAYDVEYSMSLKSTGDINKGLFKEG